MGFQACHVAVSKRYRPKIEIVCESNGARYGHSCKNCDIAGIPAKNDIALIQAGMQADGAGKCCTPAVIPGAAPPRPRLGRGRRRFTHTHTHIYIFKFIHFIFYINIYMYT